MVNTGLVWLFSWAVTDTARGRISSHSLSGPRESSGCQSNPQCPEQNFTLPWFWGRARARVALGVLLVMEKGRKEHHGESLSP